MIQRTGKILRASWHFDPFYQLRLVFVVFSFVFKVSSLVNYQDCFLSTFTSPSIVSFFSLSFFLPLSLFLYLSLSIYIYIYMHMCFNQRGDIPSLNGRFLKLVVKFTYLWSSVSSTETDINTQLAKAWTAIDRLSVIWKSDLTDKIKQFFFLQAAVVSILIYGCTTIWTLTKRMEKKLDGNYTRMLRAILNKSLRQHPTKQQLYGHLPPITKSKLHEPNMQDTSGEVGTNSCDVLQWNPSHRRAKAGWPARTYIQQLCADVGFDLKDLPEAIDDREGWRERVFDISADGVTWWWWWWYDIFIYHYNHHGLLTARNAFHSFLVIRFSRPMLLASPLDTIQCHQRPG